MKATFKLVSSFSPGGDQPQAIEKLASGLGAGRQTLLGVTGSGKTYTMACLIEKTGRPALIISPNKVLAAQLYAEFKSFFPENAVEYFISYYDYYQPEAYLPQTDTYIEKDADINEHIDRLRLRATASLLARKDVIVVASVSCIYNIGSPENYAGQCLALRTGSQMSRTELTARLVQMRYDRNEVDFTHGKFRARGGAVDVFPPYSQTAFRVSLDGGIISRISEIAPLSGDELRGMESAWIYPAKHFIAAEPELKSALSAIKEELKDRLSALNSAGKLLEAQRLKQRTEYDLEMLAQTGYCSGVENYSRHLAGRAAGERPMTLIDYFRRSGDDFLVFVDESHVAIPQIRGMQEGDRARKQTLIDFGFRLPSALDNRPLKFPEFEALTPNAIFTSATPGPYEFQKSGPRVVEQIIRPTGLVDPPVSVHETKGQIAHLAQKIKERAARGERSLVLTLTKKTAEDLAAYLSEKGLRARHLHSDIDTLERVAILSALRKGEFDALVGINLLREGLDIPEVSLVAILEADNEGFLRSETTLVQISGRAARHLGGEVILYADNITGSMSRALAEMDRRRKLQAEYNQKHGITPKSVIKAVGEFEEFQRDARKTGLAELKIPAEKLTPASLPKIMEELERRMRHAADNLDFELAADLRDQLFGLKEMSASRRPQKKPPNKNFV